MGFLRRRFFTAIGAFIVVINLDFILPRLVPGNAADILASGTKVPQTAAILIANKLGLHQPLSQQYILYLKGIFMNWPPYFGVSYMYYPQNVSGLILSRLPWTLILIVSSFLLSLAIGFTLATFSIMKRGSKTELGSLYGSILLWSTPGFWIALLLIWTFSVWLHILPVSGVIGFHPGTGINYFISVAEHALLPVLALTAVIFGQGYVIIRGTAQQILQSDFVSAAKLRGLRDRVLAVKYVLQNSLLPLISLLGYSIASIISAEIIIEYVFGYGGFGDLLVDGVLNRDYPVLEGTLFYVTLVVILFTLLGDFLLVRLDPRLRS